MFVVKYDYIVIIKNDQNMNLILNPKYNIKKYCIVKLYAYLYSQCNIICCLYTKQLFEYYYYYYYYYYDYINLT